MPTITPFVDPPIFRGTPRNGFEASDVEMADIFGVMAMQGWGCFVVTPIDVCFYEALGCTRRNLTWFLLLLFLLLLLLLFLKIENFRVTKMTQWIWPIQMFYGNIYMKLKETGIPWSAERNPWKLEKTRLNFSCRSYSSSVVMPWVEWSLATKVEPHTSYK